MSVVLVYMTAENKAEAERIGSMLVEKAPGRLRQHNRWHAIRILVGRPT